MRGEEDKGEWAKTADDGIVPPDLSGDEDDPSVGRTTGDDTPAPGSFARHATPLASLHCTGRPNSFVTPVPVGPRSCPVSRPVG